MAGALEQQTATAEILRVISGSPTDMQPVFDAIVMNAVRLCRGEAGSVFRFDGGLIHWLAGYNVPDDFRQAYPMPIRPVTRAWPRADG